MIRSQFMQTHTRNNTLRPRDILALKPRAVTALLLVLVSMLGTMAIAQTAFAADPAPVAEAAAAPGKVNINSADAQTLAKGLKGVGASRAEEIVRHRETYGPFASVDELTEVKGIGQSTLDSNRDLITLE
jgi:competence protein ComEA